MVKNSPRKATSRCLFLTESSFKLMALDEEEAGVDNDQDTVSGTYLGDTVPFEEFEATD